MFYLLEIQRSVWCHVAGKALMFHQKIASPTCVAISYCQNERHYNAGTKNPDSYKIVQDREDCLIDDN